MIYDDFVMESIQNLVDEFKHPYYDNLGDFKFNN